MTARDEAIAALLRHEHGAGTAAEVVGAFRALVRSDVEHYAAPRMIYSYGSGGTIPTPAGWPGDGSEAKPAPVPAESREKGPVRICLLENDDGAYDWYDPSYYTPSVDASKRVDYVRADLFEQAAIDALRSAADSLDYEHPAHEGGIGSLTESQDSDVAKWLRDRADAKQRELDAKRQP